MNHENVPTSGHSAGAQSAGRRRVLYAGVAAAAALAGAGLAWWKFQPSAVTAEAALWGLTFDTPTGEKLVMQSLRGKPLLVNFWATWCAPCIEEMPLLDRFYRENSAKSWQVLGLAIDQAGAVDRFLKKTPVSYPVGMAGMEGTDLGRSLGNTVGGLPFTVAFDAAGAVLHRKIGQLTPADLQQWAALK
ncbi:MAG: TlpA disulfide reductase family protein [Rhodoferax sp.]|nr:TlpA disulfide reductase family protein [Rhodoferax sp.]